MSSSLLPTITIFIGFILILRQKVARVLTHIVPKTRNTSIFHLAHLTLDLTFLHHQQHWIKGRNRRGEWERLELLGRWSGCWVRDWWSYDRRRQTDRKTGLRVYRITILDLEKRRRKMGIRRRRRRRKKGTREEGSKQEAAEKKKDSELV